MNDKTHWIILPAAGIGSRMKADRPKQYLELCNKTDKKTVIEHTLDKILAYGKFYKVIVVITKDDPYWHSINQKRGYEKDSRIWVVDGGTERCYSVLNGLVSIKNYYQNLASTSLVTSSSISSASINTLSISDAYVAIHDVARPCITYSDLDLLLNAVETNPEGAILANPVRDTMKRGSLNKNKLVSIDHTVDREQLWHALTPQVFPVEALLNNLQLALKDNIAVTDEASAMEYAGIQPLLVNGRSDNLKITRPEDLALAEFYLNNS